MSLREKFEDWDTLALWHHNRHKDLYSSTFMRGKPVNDPIFTTVFTAIFSEIGLSAAATSVAAQIGSAVAMTASTRGITVIGP
ncbi:hypothetical protein BTR14_13110 [Rhizobium rhizosphaerae]|uniref:Uncharacterized protein n=1 Tax=Xaviernesmea rhizosphaerae TaxID=1672749 RepID=A0ABX3PD65_9HYPH|nr:hypothetical protein [Xaviernesmea rhizosphaerae]OQP86016.1 hypothetical protein BTR14_13110 [Xaviernesmea rhizosphaerae]